MKNLKIFWEFWKYWIFLDFFFLIWNSEDFFVFGKSQNMKISKSEYFEKKIKIWKSNFFFSQNRSFNFLFKENIFGQDFEEQLFWPLLNFQNALLWSKRIISLPCTMFMILMPGMLEIFLSIWNFCAEEAHRCKFRSYREDKKNFCAEESHRCKFHSWREDTCDHEDKWGILAPLKYPFFNLSLERRKITNRECVQNDGNDISFRLVK